MVVDLTCVYFVAKSLSVLKGGATAFSATDMLMAKALVQNEKRISLRLRSHFRVINCLQVQHPREAWEAVKDVATKADESLRAHEKLNVELLTERLNTIDSEITAHKNIKARALVGDSNALQQMGEAWRGIHDAIADLLEESQDDLKSVAKVRTS
eukprot:7228764-Pyramimonas_sp.AAC.1